MHIRYSSRAVCLSWLPLRTKDRKMGIMDMESAMDIYAKFDAPEMLLDGRFPQ